MATAAEEKIAELDEQFLTCEVCAERYKRPKNLPCGHTFCQECLENWAKANRGKELTCPNCRQLWQLPVGGVDHLPTNYHLKGMIESLVEREEIKKTNSGDSTMCESCESKEATSACLECSQLICDDCAKVHKRLKSTAGHQVVSLEDYSANCENQLAKLKTNKCDQHPGIQLEFYCQTCSIPICLKCTIVDHRVPEHKHVYLSEEARDTRISMNETLAKVADWLNHYDENETSIKQAKQKLTDSREQALLRVVEHKEVLVKKIQQNEKELKETINNTYEANVKVLDSQLDRIELAKVQVQSSMEYAKNLVELGTDAGLMSVNKQTQEMLEELINEEIQVGPQFDHSLQYSPNMAFANGQQGRVTHNKTEVAKSSVYNKAVPFNSFIKNTKPYVTLDREITYMLSICDKHGNLVKKEITDSEVTAQVTYQGNYGVSTLDIKKNSYSDGTCGITFTPIQHVLQYPAIPPTTIPRT